MARKVVNRKELRAQNDAAEAREKTKKSTKEKTPKAKKEKAPKDPTKVAAKKPSRKKTAKEARMKAYWGVYNQGMKRLAMFEYSDKKAAEKKAADLMASSRTNHFIQLVKEAITE
jgi:outer membrane biosynthesis protein TonB